MRRRQTRQFFFRLQCDHLPLAISNQLVTIDHINYTRNRIFSFLLERVSSTGSGHTKMRSMREKATDGKINNREEKLSQMPWIHATCDNACSVWLCPPFALAATKTRKNSRRVNSAGRFWYVIAISLSQDSLISMSFFPFSCLLASQKIGRCSICGYTALSAWETSTETEKSKTICVRNVSADWRSGEMRTRKKLFVFLFGILLAPVRNVNCHAVNLSLSGEITDATYLWLPANT